MKKILYIFFLSLLAISCKTLKKENSPTTISSYNSISEKDKNLITSLLIDGVKNKNIGNYEEAIFNFNRILNLDKNNHLAYYQLALTYQIQEKHYEALEYSEKSVELSPTNQWYLLTLGEIYDETKKSDLAIKIWQQLVEVYPDNIDYHYNIILSNIYLGKWVEAIKGYDNIEKIMGISETISFAKRKIWLHINNLKKADEEVKKLISAYPTDTKYKLMLGDIYLDKNELDKAKNQYDSILLIEPEHGPVLLSLANYYRRIKDDTKSYDYIKLSFRNPNVDIDSKVKILLSYFELSDKFETIKSNAYELIDIMLSTHPEEAKGWSISADFYLQDKEYKKAETAFLKVIKYDNSKYLVWEQLLYLMSLNKNFDSIIDLSSQAIELFPSQPNLFYFQGVAYYSKGNYKDATNSLNMAKNLMIEEDKLLVEILIYLGESYHKLNNWEGSDVSFEKVLKIEPDNIYVLNNYSYYLSLRNENLDKAEQYAKKLIDIKGNNSSYLDTYAWVLFKKGNYSEAKIYIERAISLNSNISSTIIEHYGDILWKNNNKKEAMGNWKKAASMVEKPTEILLKKINKNNYFE